MIVSTTQPDVIVVGGGNAGYCAAHAAAQSGAQVVLLEKGAPDAASGNSFYTAGAFRVMHGGLDALGPLFDDERTSQRMADTELEPYGSDAFWADMRRLTQERCDPHLTGILIEESADAARWLADLGIRWRLMYERQAYERDGRWVFWGGLALGTVDGGKGLMAQHEAAASRAESLEVVYGAAVIALERDAEGVQGVRFVDPDGVEASLRAPATVIAAGGFEANAELRERYLGPGWQRALIRGTPLNTGEVLEAALATGAAPYGDWSSCHSVAWDVGASQSGGDRELTNQHTRSGYPLGIMVNRDGHRFVDEGAD